MWLECGVGEGGWKRICDKTKVFETFAFGKFRLVMKETNKHIGLK